MSSQLFAARMTIARLHTALKTQVEELEGLGSDQSIARAALDHNETEALDIFQDVRRVALYAEATLSESVEGHHSAVRILNLIGRS